MNASTIKLDPIVAHLTGTAGLSSMVDCAPAAGRRDKQLPMVGICPDGGVVSHSRAGRVESGNRSRTDRRGGERRATPSYRVRCGMGGVAAPAENPMARASPTQREDDQGGEVCGVPIPLFELGCLQRERSFETGIWGGEGRERAAGERVRVQV